jgi:RimJ/RimL family protein N-acetyltransferase
MFNKLCLSNQTLDKNVTIQRLFPHKNVNQLVELLDVYKRNKKHLHYWHREMKELLFKDPIDYEKYLNNGKLFCYALQFCNKIIGCIEIGRLSIDEDSYKERFLAFWIDKNYTRKGIIYNALLKIEEIFSKEKLDYISADVHSENEPSINMLKKLKYGITSKYTYIDCNSGEREGPFIRFKKKLTDITII